MFRKLFSPVIVLVPTVLSSFVGAWSGGGGTSQPGTSTVTVTSATPFPSSPVRITFTTSDFTIGLFETPHLRFTIDGGLLNDFYRGSSPHTGKFIRVPARLPQQSTYLWRPGSTAPFVMWC